MSGGINHRALARRVDRVAGVRGHVDAPAEHVALTNVGPAPGADTNEDDECVIPAGESIEYDPGGATAPDDAWRERATASVRAKAKRYESGGVDPVDGVGHGYVGKMVNWGVLTGVALEWLTANGYTLRFPVDPSATSDIYQVVYIEPPARDADAGPEGGDAEERESGPESGPTVDATRGLPRRDGRPRREREHVHAGRWREGRRVSESVGRGEIYRRPGRGGNGSTGGGSDSPYPAWVEHVALGDISPPFGRRTGGMQMTAGRYLDAGEVHIPEDADPERADGEVGAVLARLTRGDVDPSDGVGHGYVHGALDWGILRGAHVASLIERGWRVWVLDGSATYRVLALVPPGDTDAPRG